MAKEYIPHVGLIVTRAEAIERGEKRYFTGKKCKRGHTSQRQTASLGCRECDRLLRSIDHRPTDVVVKVKNRNLQGADEARTKGDKHYTGTPCIKCGSTLRYVQSGACVPCGRKHAKEQRDSDPVGFREYIREHRETYNYVRTDVTREKDKARAERKYREARNFYEFCRLLFIICNWSAFQDILADMEVEKKKRQSLKPIKNAAGSKAWRKSNPEKSAAADRNKKARRKGAEGKHTKEDIIRIGESQRWRCAWCRTPTKQNYHVDHIISLAKGGTNWPRNLVISCGPCNMKKKTKDPILFARSLGKLL